MSESKNQSSENSNNAVEKIDEKSASTDNTLAEKENSKRKKKIWDSRAAFIKSGHLSMQSRRYSEAAVSYEKYIRILELYFEVPAGGLTPEIFKESAKTSELAILSSIYWDLIRVYDSNESYSQRQANAAIQLAKFAVLTPIHHDLVTQAESFLSKARNPQNVKLFLTGVGKTSKCFIATAAFQNPDCYEVIFFRHYRDSVLSKHKLGLLLIHVYYRYSAFWADKLQNQNFMKSIIRWLLRAVIKCVSYK